MEDVLEVYTRPYDPLRPQVCMDETSRQLLRDTKETLPMEPGRSRGEDYEYESAAGLPTCSHVHRGAFMGRRWVDITEHRTKVEWAHQIKELVDLRYPEAERIVLVMDNLNTHSPASLYEAFDPSEARRLAQKLEIHYTPKHGSWLNMAEIELSVLSRQCLQRRVPDFGWLEAEAHAWQERRDAAGVKIEWRFSKDDARIKLKRRYPSLQE